MEVKEALCSMKSDSALGPDGLSLEFYKIHWSIVKNDVMNMVTDFFDGRRSLKHLNSIFTTLIPKTEEASEIAHFRPILCAKVIYKTISKVLSTRLSPILPQLLSLNQIAFVKGRNIFDNSALAEEMLWGFEQKATGKQACICVIYRRLLIQFMGV